jgi:hypothetical protein
MGEDLGYWNWFTALGALLVGLPLAGAFLGFALRAAGLSRAGRACVRGALYGYVGAATATFTGIGITFFTYIFHWWRFPGEHERVPAVLYVVFLSVLIIIPLAGLIGGAFYGVTSALRATPRPNQAMQRTAPRSDA